MLDDLCYHGTGHHVASAEFEKEERNAEREFWKEGGVVAGILFVSKDSMTVLCHKFSSGNQCPDGCSVKHLTPY